MTKLYWVKKVHVGMAYDKWVWEVSYAEEQHNSVSMDINTIIWGGRASRSTKTIGDKAISVENHL